jgi:hypothetical protein
VDDIADDLLRAEDEARLAAEAAGRTAAGLPDQEGDDAPIVQSAVAEAPTGEAVGAEMTSIDSTTPGSASDPSLDATDSDSGDVSASETGNGTGHEQHVEDLFARLRASGLGDGPSARDPGDTGESARTEAPSADVGSSVVEPALTPAMERTSNGGIEESRTGESTTAAPATLSDDEPTLILARPLQLVRRDELLGPVIAGLARRVKRALQDDQNDILDRLRSQGGWKDGVLPELSEHTARYVEAAKEMLAEAARAGSTFAGVSIERAQGVDTEAGELANALVGPLRRRLEDDCPTVDPTDDAALVEHVGAAFREWRGDRTERLAGDHATAAFSASAMAGTSHDVTIRWIVDDEGGPCADCEDNALAEDVSPGDPFPTGHPHPPAHSGCRCLLVVRAT